MWVLRWVGRPGCPRSDPGRSVDRFACPKVPDPDRLAEAPRRERLGGPAGARQTQVRHMSGINVPDKSLTEDRPTHRQTGAPSNEVLRRVGGPAGPQVRQMSGTFVPDKSLTEDCPTHRQTGAPRNVGAPVSRSAGLPSIRSR